MIVDFAKNGSVAEGKTFFFCLMEMATTNEIHTNIFPFLVTCNYRLMTNHMSNVLVCSNLSLPKLYNNEKQSTFKNIELNLCFLFNSKCDLILDFISPTFMAFYLRKWTKIIYSKALLFELPPFHCNQKIYLCRYDLNSTTTSAIA